ncbi:RebB family R body protein [Kordiimonas marina]|uniref:RebB family R body protein n=1 Tax=Kordiimonas marina TaxID=2872312 RepID=UPI001FF2E605|nr:RebB family R body protein [Kordiimonas marina]MCJ9429358.1 RebB family R body protein [Kordiimonas marina]
MADNTPVNGQITDSVSQSNVAVLGNSPAVGLGAIYQSLGHSTGLMFENAVGAQQQLAIAGQTATNEGVIQIYTVNTMASAAATSKIAASDTPSTMMANMSALKASRGY